MSEEPKQQDQSRAPDLTFCTMDELWKEMKKRCCACVLITEMPAVQGESRGIQTWWKGHVSAAHGLLAIGRIQAEAMYLARANLEASD